MTPRIEIDADSGFCFGVVTAIRKAEQELDATGKLYCLGDIVHNSNEVDRLCAKGLTTITHADLDRLRDVKVLLRAHGEPPQTYARAAEHNIEIIDATCPVVLQLQKRIKSAYEQGRGTADAPLILIYGKPGHAEVNGLVGQTEGTAVVIQSAADLDNVDLDRDILLYSQTTKSLTGFNEVVEAIKARKTRGGFRYFDTICRRVAGRMPRIRDFAMCHEVILFVSGRKSSNGKALFEECRRVNPRSYFITDPSEIQPEWLRGVATVGIAGATSTPRWLMERVKDTIEKNYAV
ncbi:MAG: 4-hydroxy-3-methylbut-2-enyl diphosphate reductase [Muribaculaceae bacterium]|nr:4-hydroxy-3-methylbut-2-enyl diphosphate reductase [Muribaculaceae bacterium]